MKFFTNNVKYSILAGLAAYGVYNIALNIIGIGAALQHCDLETGGTISIVCYLFGMS